MTRRFERRLYSRALTIRSARSIGAGLDPHGLRRRQENPNYRDESIGKVRTDQDLSPEMRPVASPQDQRKGFCFDTELIRN